MISVRGVARAAILAAMVLVVVGAARADMISFDAPGALYATQANNITILGGGYQSTNISSLLAKVYGSADLELTGTSGSIRFEGRGHAAASLGQQFLMTITDSVLYTGGGSVTLTARGAFGLNTTKTYTGSPTPQVMTASALSPLVVSEMPPQGIMWYAYIDMNWTGTPGETMNVTIPLNSLDYTIVPEPATLSLLALGGLVALRRRTAS